MSINKKFIDKLITENVKLTDLKIDLTQRLGNVEEENIKLKEVNQEMEHQNNSLGDSRRVGRGDRPRGGRGRLQAAQKDAGSSNPFGDNQDGDNQPRRGRGRGNRGSGRGGGGRGGRGGGYHDPYA